MDDIAALLLAYFITAVYSELLSASLAQLVTHWLAIRLITRSIPTGTTPMTPV